MLSWKFIRVERKFGRSVNGQMIQRKALVFFPKLYSVSCASFRLKHEQGGFEECCYGITCLLEELPALAKKSHQMPPNDAIDS